MNEYIEIRVAVTDNAVREIVIAKLTSAGAEGFEEEKNCLKAFVPASQFQECAVDEIIRPTNLTYTTSVIGDRNWNAEWEANFQPVIIDDFCVIRANFHPPVAGIVHDIVITPKMSFGTGHHATTFMMIQAMSQLNFKGNSVFDFGTGTGVLAILAEKLGATSITAIDNDSWSIENSLENINTNKCHNILLFNEKGFFDDSHFDLILANINLNTILKSLSAIKQHLKPGGVLLMSGLLTGDELMVLTKAENCGLKLNKKIEKNGWICLELIDNE